MESYFYTRNTPVAMRGQTKKSHKEKSVARLKLVYEEGGPSKKRVEGGLLFWGYWEPRKPRELLNHELY